MSKFHTAFKTQKDFSKEDEENDEQENEGDQDGGNENEGDEQEGDENEGEEQENEEEPEEYKIGEIKYDFYANYDDNLAKILEVRNKTSGTHKIDTRKAEKWVNAQLNEQRKHAARALLQNVHYITFSTLFTEVGKLIKEIYASILEKNEVYLYAGKPTNSFYFMSVIAVYFIRHFNLPDPRIIHTLEGHINKTILIIDDMSYTGIQMGKIHDRINSGENNNILLLGLVAVAEQAKKSFEQLSLTLYCHNVIPDLRQVLGKQTFLEISYYFSPAEEGQTRVCVYFDHKIGDPLSTFLKVLMYGPIPPADLGYEPLSDHDMYTIVSGIVESVVWHPPQNRQATKEERKREDDGLIAWDKEFSSYISLLDQIHAADNTKWIPGYKSKKLNFIPFIGTCKPPDLRAFPDISYYDFISGRALNYKYKERQRERKADEAVGKFEEEQKALVEEEEDPKVRKTLNKAFIKRIAEMQNVNELEQREATIRMEKYQELLSSLIDPKNRCIHSFYKKGQCIMV